MAFETDPWPYRQAANHGVQRSEAPRHIIWHSTQSTGTARAIWQWFAEPGDKGSAHVTAGEDGLFQSVLDSYVPHAAPGANHDGMHIEFVGRAEWSRREWLSREKTLRNGASATAQYALKYELPLTLITDRQLAANWKGVTDHDAVSDVFKRSTHWDVGEGFPMDVVLEMAQEEYKRRTTKVAPPPVVLDPLPPFDYDVAFIWRPAPDGTTPEEGVANMLAAEHRIRATHVGDNAFVGIRVNLGFEEEPREEGLVAINGFAAANRRETADLARRGLLHNADRIEELREWGRNLRAARAQGRLS